MSSQIRYTVTAALPYTNGPVHIGHLGGVYLPADIYCRYLRLKGEDVLFICGSDEHGVAITIKARKEGITPQELVDKYHQIIKQSFEDFGISFDIYSRTSLPIHHETAQEFFLQWERQGKLIQKTTQQFFDPKEQLFLADRYIIGTCPKCQNENAYGDQCEKCGSSLAPSELINPRSALSGETPILKETSHWYLPLDQYQTFLEDYILKQHCDWKPNVFGQCKSWLNEGLQPRAITRDMDWGVKLPLPNTDGKVLYVWFDAPIGYISATKDLFQQRANQGAAHADDWKPYWQDPNTRLIHFIGKD
ncbi:MAG: class I tRNA ligase family protein, partial [Bacteroidia bacterium]|nr:class I tRNA ligase family protein [Bacteroidia bacterium]